MHDFFDVLGLPRNAPAGEIRRVCARRARRSHPDFRATTEGPSCPPRFERASWALERDVAVDFVDIRSLFDRIESAFFTSGR